MPIFHRSLPVTLTLLSTAAALAAPGNLALSGLFSDHMVLQRNHPIVVWGTTAANDSVTVKIGEDQATAKADANGEWTAKLPERKAGGEPLTLTVSDADETTSIQDILIGDVWVCSGQSNMEFQLRRTSNAEEAIKSSTNNNIRIYDIERQRALKPQKELKQAGIWQVAAPDTVPLFSGVGYFFGKKLQEELDIPIGLINSSWGGTKVQWWTPMEGIDKIPFYDAEAASVREGKSNAALAKEYQKALAGWLEKTDTVDPGVRSNWAAPSFDVSGWKSVDLPENKNQGTLGKANGTAWYRRSFDLTAEQAGTSFQAELACLDDVAVVYINGKKIGHSQTPLTPLKVTIPAGMLKDGSNIIAVQIIDFGKGGGICGKPGNLKLSSTTRPQDSIVLAGEWKYKLGVPLKELPAAPTPPPSIRPTVLYNAMIAPLLKFPITGAIWYQGEGNANEAMAPYYAETFSTMIDLWRKNWSVGEFPFLFVELASFREIELEPGESNWAVLREQQQKTLKLTPNTALASAIDVGEEHDIHPKNKLDVGNRLAQAALALEYGKDVVPMGPIYKSSEIKDGKVIISFEYAKSLKTKNGEPLKGFSIAGADGKFIWADASIDGNTVVVSSDKIPTPVAVRYGWATYSTGNLYNGADLPASPFRTDQPK